MKKVLISALVVFCLVLAVSCTTNYTVKFEANEGTPAPAAQTVAAGGVVVEPVSPEKTGYTFTGWYSDSTCATKYNFATRVNSSFTLYAGYSKNVEPVAKTYTVTFNSNGGSEVASQTVKEGECAVRPLNPTKAGYEFVDWYTAIGLETGVAYSFTSKVEKDLTLIAKWVDEAGAIIVTFNSNGGSAVSRQGFDKASYVIKPEDPVKAGYTFVGWYKDKALTTPFYKLEWNDDIGEYDTVVDYFKGNDYSELVGESMTLYAAYEETGEFTIVNGVLTAVNVKDAEGTKTGVKSITIPDGVIAIEESSDGNTVFKGYTSLEKVVIPSTLTTIGAKAFKDCTSLKYIVSSSATKSLIEQDDFILPATVKTVGDRAFVNCDSIKNAVLEGVLVLNRIFPECDNLRTIEVPSAVSVCGQGESTPATIYAPLVTKPDQISQINNSAVFVISSDADISEFTGVNVVKEPAADGKTHVTTLNEIKNAVWLDGASIVLDSDIFVTTSDTINVNGDNVSLDLNNKKIVNAAQNGLNVSVFGTGFTVDVYDLEDLQYFACQMKGESFVSGEVTVVLSGSEKDAFTESDVPVQLIVEHDVILDLNGKTLKLDYIPEAGGTISAGNVSGISVYDYTATGFADAPTLTVYDSQYAASSTPRFDVGYLRAGADNNDYGAIRILNGSFKTYIRAEGTGSIEIEDGYFQNGRNVNNSSTYAVYSKAAGDKITVNGGTFVDRIGTNGSNSGTVVTINGGTFLKGVFLSAGGTYTINGGSFSSYKETDDLTTHYYAPVQLRGGDLTINGGTFTAGSEAAGCVAGTGDGIWGCALGILGSDGYADISVTVNGGSFAANYKTAEKIGYHDFGTQKITNISVGPSLGITPVDVLDI